MTDISVRCKNCNRVPHTVRARVLGEGTCWGQHTDECKEETRRLDLTMLTTSIVGAARSSRGVEGVTDGGQSIVKAGETAIITVTMRDGRRVTIMIG